MKKALTLVLALVLCLSVLSVAALAADYDSVSIIGTIFGTNWDADFAMSETSDNVYTLTKYVEAGEYEFKMRANNDWNLNWGGTFLASGQAFDVYKNGANIVFTVEEACDVTFELDLTNFDGSNGAKCTITIGGKVEAPVEVAKIKVHVSVPENWGDVYVYVWGPEHLGSWAGTKLTGEYIEVPASFEGMVINNGNGRQAADIKDIDLTKKEVWIVISESNGYTLYYEAPTPEEEQPQVGKIKVHVSVPEGWGDIYVYVWNPEQLGSWSGTKLEGEYIEVPAAFEGMVINNGNGRQAADIKDIDLTKEEVWIVISESNGYTLYYEAPTGEEEEPEIDTIKVHVSVPEGWGDIYVYVWNPEQLGSWSGTKLEGEYIEVPAAFEGMVINNGNGTQSWDIKDIDLTQDEVWITVSADGSYTLTYQGGNNLPNTGDNIVVMFAVMMMAATGAVVMLSKKKYF